MSYQIVCDNCDASVSLTRDDARFVHKPTGWDFIYGSDKADGIMKHLCDKCVMAKDQAKWSAQEKVRQAEEAALAARRVKA